ncbi:tetratricopeptide repeat protein [Neptunicella marina]|uniref:Tetratricopeptide repeat protein n=1 Tax=Neptunicella marina TaxID=2125989 RepID=A0A8J6IUB6_9ALTE|nr:tetratricopeptide repeat protein [Neptunicella marina]MBC3765768.1 tetratricopeptide repeat protein [Neptunicella marina]
MCRKISYGANQYGPIDYFDSANYALGAGGREKENNVTIVTNYHFTPDIKNLIKGRTSHHLSKDLDYTLRAIPNNVVALDTASRFQKKRQDSVTYAKDQKPLPYFVDCYFKRAIDIFGPKQPQLWMVWAIHKHRNGLYQDALKYYQLAVTNGLKSAELDYNMGLTYFKLGSYEEARVKAKSAYQQGYQLPGLKILLEDAGYPIE